MLRSHTLEARRVVALAAIAIGALASACDDSDWHTDLLMSIGQSHRCQFTIDGDWYQYGLGIDHDDPRQCPPTELPYPGAGLSAAGALFDFAGALPDQTGMQDFLDAQLLIKSYSSFNTMANEIEELQLSPSIADMYIAEFNATFVADTDGGCQDWVFYSFLTWAYPTSVTLPSGTGYLNYVYPNNVPPCPGG